MWGWIVLTVGLGCFLTGATVGSRLEELHNKTQQLTAAVKTVERLKTEIKIQDRVVAQYIQTTQTVTVTEHAIAQEIPLVVRADCVVPPDLLVQLHAISRGIPATNSGVTEDQAQGADCRTVAAAIGSAYAQHFRLIAQLNSILDWDEAPR